MNGPPTLAPRWVRSEILNREAKLGVVQGSADGYVLVMFQTEVPADGSMVTKSSPNGYSLNDIVLSQQSFRLITRLSSGPPTGANALIQGDNLHVLRALRCRYLEAIRCVYIDPPYNSQERYTHYADTDAEDVWLGAIVERVKELRDFLREDGSIWISIDDRQMHYLKIALDQVMGRENFVTTIVWEQRTTRENRKVFSNNHEYILVYAKNSRRFRETRGLLAWNSEVLERFRNPDNDPRGPWQSVSANVQAGHATPGQFYQIISPTGRSHQPPKGRCWVYTRHRMADEIASNNVWFGKDGNAVPRLKRFLANSRRGFTPHTLWTAEEVGTNDEAKKHQLRLFPNSPLFDTPKPEGLIERILSIATVAGDIVLDAYLGSGTTAAVAHKMGRQYVGIEIGDHAVSHCVERMRAVIGGEQGGVSEKVGWSGGCGFRFYRYEELPSALAQVKRSAVVRDPDTGGDGWRGYYRRQPRTAVS